MVEMQSRGQALPISEILRTWLSRVWVVKEPKNKQGGCLQGPFTYEALLPEDINFEPLKQTRSFNARELLEVKSLSPAKDHLGSMP